VYIVRLLKKMPDGAANNRDSGPEQNDRRNPEGDFKRPGQTIVKTDELPSPSWRGCRRAGIFGMEQETEEEDEDGSVGFLHGRCLGWWFTIAVRYLIR
jgi:hypothetical protein